MLVALAAVDRMIAPADRALMRPSPHAHAHLATTFCMTLGCSAQIPAACSRCCADFLCRRPKFLVPKLLSAKHQLLHLLLPQTYSHWRAPKATMDIGMARPLTGTLVDYAHIL